MNKEELTEKAQEAFDKTIELLHDYRTGAKIGGNAMKYIIEFAENYKNGQCKN